MLTTMEEGSEEKGAKRVEAMCMHAAPRRTRRASRGESPRIIGTDAEFVGGAVCQLGSQRYKVRLVKYSWGGLREEMGRQGRGGNNKGMWGGPL